MRVLRVDIEERKIGLSFVHADFEENRRFLEGGAPAAAEGEPAAEGAPDAEGEQADAEEAGPAEAAATQGQEAASEEKES